MTINPGKNIFDSEIKTNTKFKKVSIEKFTKDWIEAFPEDEDNYEYIKTIYDNIKLPKRHSNKSAKYKFFLPMEIIIPTYSSMTIPTGIEYLNVSENEVLMIYPNRELGINNRFVLSNSIEIINEESYNPNHITISMVNDGDDELHLDSGEAFCNGILINCNITGND